MTALEAIRQAEAVGVRLSVDGLGRLVAAPPGRLPADVKAVLVAEKEAVLALLRPPVPGLDVLLRSSLWRLDRTLVCDVPGLGGQLFITPSCAEAKRLRATEPLPCAVLCVCRVLDLLLSGVDPAGARAAIEAALLFDAEVSEVRQ
jgi:hypothetical protein